MNLESAQSATMVITELVILIVGISLFSCFFGQLTARNSLRDIATCLQAHKNKLYHLGMNGYVNQGKSI